MAMFFHDRFRTLHGSRNFGDNINEFLLPKLFRHSILDDDDVCILGIGTILNDRNRALVAGYGRKVVFTSGVGYGTLSGAFDDTWDFVCVRGPRTAQALGLPAERAICDGAILLSDYYPPEDQADRNGQTVFIPHIKTGWSAGHGLRTICTDLGIVYLSPEAPPESFIKTVQQASLVVTEAMHGAILADTMRTPWIPIDFIRHLPFKWHDWFDSIERPSAIRRVRPQFWDEEATHVMARLRAPYRHLKRALAKRSLASSLDSSLASLSSDQVIEDRRTALRSQVEVINDRYS